MQATQNLSRQRILQALQGATKPQDYVLAMWEGGAAAFNRVDQWSDIDLYFASNDDDVARTVEAVEKVLSSLGSIALRYEPPQPSWHGHWQAFYLLRDTSPFLVLDIVIMRNSSANRFLEPEIHGDVKVWFDKSCFTKTQPFDRDKLDKKLKGRLETLKATFPMFQPFVAKELNRGNNVEALAFYQGVTLRPLVELLRIKHCPTRHDFNTRYVYYDLPANVTDRLEKLFFVADPDELQDKREQAEEWFRSLLSEIDRKEDSASRP